MAKELHIKLALPQLSSQDSEAVQEAVSQNWVTAGGPFVSDFEANLQMALDTNREVMALSSGTAALHLALRLAGVKSGDFVICQTMSFVATSNPIAYLNAIPVFIDSEPETFNMSVPALEEAIQFCIAKNKKPAAIIAVHSFGIPSKIREIAALAEEYNIPLIEDAAEALGSKVADRACGTFGDFGVLSFNGNKLITTGGGGALICKDAAQPVKARHLARQAKISSPGFEHDEIGYNYAMPGLNAALGASQLKTLSEKISAKRNLHNFYNKIIADVEGVAILSPTADSFSNYWLNVIRFYSEQQKYTASKLLKHLENLGIESRFPWKPLHLQGIYKEQYYFGSTIAETLWQNGLCLPSGCGLTNSEQNEIQNALNAYFSA